MLIAVDLINDCKINVIGDTPREVIWAHPVAVVKLLGDVFIAVFAPRDGKDRTEGVEVVGCRHAGTIV